MRGRPRIDQDLSQMDLPRSSCPLERSQNSLLKQVPKGVLPLASFLDQ